MAGAVCFRRRWAFASDEWIFLAPWIVFLHVVFAVFISVDHPTAAVCATCCILFDLFLAVWSCQGPIYDIDGRRDRLPAFLGFRLVINFAEACGCAALTYTASTRHTYYTSLVALILTASVVISAPAFNRGCSEVIPAADKHDRVVPLVLRLFLRWFGARAAHLAALGELLLRFGELDMTVMDVLTGLLLMAKPPYPNGVRVESDDPALRLIKHYASYASLIYGWPINLMIAGTSQNTTFPSACKCARLFCSPSSCPKPNPNIVGDNCLYWNTACVERWIQERKQVIGECTLVRASFFSSTEATPWLIMDDHALRKTVIAIRGTMSISDAIIDSMVHLVPLAGGGACHEGFHCCAMRLLEDLAEFIENARFPLVLVGHSMGASIATICGLHLRERGHMDLEVIAVSPPGCTITPELSDETKKFVTSMMVNEDWAPRTSICTILSLQRDIHDMLKSTPRTKIGVWLRRLLGPIVGEDDPLLYSPLARSGRHMETIAPGRLIQLRPSRFSTLFCGLYTRQSAYEAFWVDPVDLDEIVVAPKAVECHFPNIIIDAVNTLSL